MGSFIFTVLLLVAPMAVLSQNSQSLRSGDPCYHFGCQNNGNCTSSAGVAYCTCPLGFTGAKCEQRLYSRNPCEFFRCENGGTCVPSPTDGRICYCPLGYGGPNCEKKVVVRPGSCPDIKYTENESCTTKQCYEDSDCPVDGDKCCPYVCGHKCISASRDPCYAFGCQNGGNCTSSAGVAYCTCPFGFTGAKCEQAIFIWDPCANYGCQNGGYCIAPADAPYCQCPNGFTGDRCQYPPVENPGTCPQIKPGEVSVCGAAFFCSSDSECRSNQKCCKVACGHRECMTVENTQMTLTCANTLCAANTTCRHVKDAKGIVVPNCLPIGTVGQDIDEQCRRRNYSDVILIQNPRNSSSYSSLTCSSSSSSYASRSTCPSDSVCIADLSGRGVCCRGYFGPVTPRVKPGLCRRQVTNCMSRKRCNNDDDCTGEQKCCRSCGLKVCANPDPSVVQCGNGLCARGDVCVERTPCAPGKMCAQVLRPVCVPKACENCTTDRCVKLGTGYRCLPPPDSCGGCSPGQVCIFTGVVCVRAPCPWSYKCVKNNTCGGCRDGYVCQESTKQCIQLQTQ